MDPSFAVKPVFVEHVDEVDPNIDTLRNEADGWVIKSFYNDADGKHWVEFIVVSERGERAIRNGMRLSNAYIPKSFKNGGLWNGITYDKQIVDAEYEHLAIVKNPRYEESVIMTPEEFKKYNESQVLELRRLENSKGAKMKFSFFKKTKIENAIDPDLQLVLPRSGKSISLSKLINDAYEKDQDPAMGNKKNKEEEKEADKNSGLADMTHKVKMKDGSYCNVKELLDKHNKMCDEMDCMKKDSAEKELDLKTEESEVDAEGDLHNDDMEENDHEEEVETEEHKKEMNDDEEHPEDAVHDAEDPEEDKSAKKKALQLAEHEEKEIEEAKAKNKRKNSFKSPEAKARAERIRNAHLKAFATEDAPVIELSADRVDRGKVRYGS